MTLQQSISRQTCLPNNNLQILCHKCGAPIVFNKDQVSSYTKRKIPLDPYFDNEPHAQHCIYATAPSNPELEPLLFDFLSLVPRKKHIIGAVGKARD